MEKKTLANVLPLRKQEGDKMKEFTTIFLSAIAIYFLLVLCNWGLSLQCRKKAKIQNLEYNYGIIQGCMVKNANKWIDYNRLRVIE